MSRRVVVADDQALVREGIVTLLELAGASVVGQATDGQEAIELLAASRPDVLLLDLRMPRFDGIWTLTELRRREIDVPALALTTFDDDALLLSALHGGARGYLLKDVTVEQLARAVEVLADGGTLIAPSMTDRLLRAVRATAGPAAAAPLARRPRPDQCRAARAARRLSGVAEPQTVLMTPPSAR